MRHSMILVAILMLLPGATAINMYYNATMSYDNGKLTLESLSIVPLKEYDAEYYRSLNDYAAVMMQGKKALNVYYFDFNLDRHAVTLDENDMIKKSHDITLNKTTTSAYFPYDTEATDISIIDNKLMEALKINLKPEMKEEMTAEKPEEKKVPTTYILAGSILMLLLVVLWLALRKKKE